MIVLILYINLFNFSWIKKNSLFFRNVEPLIAEIPVCNAKCVYPDQTPRSVMSDLGLPCLPMSLLLDARHKWVKSTWLYTERAVEERTDNHENIPT